MMEYRTDFDKHLLQITILILFFFQVVSKPSNDFAYKINTGKKSSQTISTSDNISILFVQQYNF